MERDLSVLSCMYVAGPTDAYIKDRKALILDQGEFLSGIRHECPCCNGKNTDFCYEQDKSILWYICYDCEMPFTFEDTQERYFDLCEAENPDHEPEILEAWEEW